MSITPSRAAADANLADLVFINADNANDVGYLAVCGRYWPTDNIFETKVEGNIYTAKWRFRFVDNEVNALKCIKTTSFPAANFVEADFRLLGFQGADGWENYSLYSSNLPGATHDVAFGDSGNSATPGASAIDVDALSVNVWYDLQVSWDINGGMAPIAGQTPRVSFEFVPSHWAMTTDPNESVCLPVYAATQNKAWCVFGNTRAYVSHGYRNNVSVPFSGNQSFTYPASPPPPPPAPVGLTLAAGSYSNGQQYVFWKGGDGLLWEAWYANNMWNGPISFPQFGILWSAPTVAVNPWNGEQHVFWKSGGGTLMQAYWDGSWHGPQNLGMGVLGSGSAATAFGNEIDVFWKGGDNNLWEAWWNGSIWQGPLGLGMGPLGSAPTAAASPNGEQHVFWRGPDNNLIAGWYSGGHWNGPQVVGMGPLASQPSVVVRPTTNERDVFWRGADGNIWQAVFIGAWYGPFCVGMGILGSLPSATAWGTDVDVFWVSNGGGVLMEGYYQSGTWHEPQARGMSVIPIQP